MYSAGNNGDRMLLSWVLAQMLDAQAEQLEGQALQAWVERSHADVQNRSVPYSSANELMARSLVVGALRRRVAARMLRGEEALPSWRARRNEFVALEHGCPDLQLFMDIIAMGEEAAGHLDRDVDALRPGCFCEVASHDAEQLDQILSQAQAALERHQSAMGEDEGYQRTREALQRLGMELGRPMRAGGHAEESEGPLL